MNQYQDISSRWDEYLLNEGKKATVQRTAGNRYHAADGTFSTADDAASESIGYWETPKPGTIQGKWRRTGKGRTKVWRKLGCGRKHKHDPTVKAKHKCKVKEDILIREEDDVLLIKPGDFRELVLHEMTKLAQELAAKEEMLDEQEKERRCPPGCSTWEQFLRSVNALKSAESGRLYQQRSSK